jgi:hypothetical protein
MDTGLLFFMCLLSAFICGGLGYNIGDSKGLGGLGVALGVLLGPVGIIILAILPSEKNEINEPTTHYEPVAGVPRAVAYPSLDPDPVPRVVATPKIGKPRAPRFFVCDVGGEVRGPFTGAEITRMREDMEIDEATLFCIEGSQNWMAAPKALR